MKRKRTVFSRVLLKVRNINKPIDLILPQYEADSWHDLSSLRKSFIRFNTSPFSILELNLKYLENLEIISKTISSSEWNNQSTLFIKYLNENNLPIPKDSFNYEFNYPISFVLFKNMNKVISSDMSNYLNLEYLISNEIGVEKYLSNQNHWEVQDKKASKIILAEYSKINTIRNKMTLIKN